MVSRRTALQIGVILCLLVQAFLFSGPVQADKHVQVTKAVNVDSILDPRLVVQSLAQRPIESESYNVVSLDTSKGKVYLYFDHKRRKLQIYGDGMPTVAIDYPAEYTQDTVFNSDVLYSEQKNTFVYCAKGIFAIIPAKKLFSRIDVIGCASHEHSPWPDASWSPNGRFFAYKTPQREQRFYDAETQKILTINEIASQTTSWLNDWSPRWDYQVTARDILNLTDMERCPGEPKSGSISGYHRFTVIATARRTGSEKILFCVQWERITPTKWLDADRVLLTGWQPRSADTPVQQHFIAAMSTGKAISLGLDLGFLEYDNFTKAIRFQVQDWQPPNGPWKCDDGACIQEPPYRCTLNVLDLKTLVTKEIETSYCAQPMDIRIIEPSNMIFYMRSPIPVRTVEIPGPWPCDASPRIVDLNTLRATDMPVKDVRQINYLSPDKHYLTLVATDSRCVTRSIFDIDNIYLDPNGRYWWLVYEINKAKVVYDSRSSTGSWFEWIERTGSNPAFLLRDHKYGLRLVSLGNPPQSMPVDDFPNSEVRGSEGVYLHGTPGWSPDGQYFLFYRPNGIRMVRAKDQKILTITNALETDAFVLDARWYGANGHMLLIEAIPRQRSEPYFTSGRWVVDPARATE